MWGLICKVHLNVCYYHVTYKFQSESSLLSLPECQGTFCPKQEPYLKFKWYQRDTNPHKHLVRKGILNHLAKLAVRVFVFEQSGCGFKIRCCHLNFRYGAMLWAWISLTFRQTIENRFTPKLVCGMIIPFFLIWLFNGSLQVNFILMKNIFYKIARS